MRSNVWVDGGVVVCLEKSCCGCETSAASGTAWVQLCTHLLHLMKVCAGV